MRSASLLRRIIAFVPAVGLFTAATDPAAAADSARTTHLAPVEAERPRSREELEFSLEAALLIAEQRFIACDFDGEVEARTAVVALSAEVGRPAWQVVMQARRLETARRAAALPQARQTRLGEAREAFVAGNRLAAAGGYAAAKPFYRRAAEITEEVLGVDAFTVETAVKLGDACIAAGKFADAVAALESAVLVGSRVYDDEHPVLGHALARLAEAYAMLGRRDDADAAGDRAFASCAAQFTGADLAVLHLNLARLRLLCRRYAAAEQEARRALSLLGPRDTERARFYDLLARQLIARTLTRRGWTDAARQTLVAALAEAEPWPRSDRIEGVMAALKSSLARAEGPAEATVHRPDDSRINRVVSCRISRGDRLADSRNAVANVSVGLNEARGPASAKSVAGRVGSRPGQSEPTEGAHLWNGAKLMPNERNAGPVDESSESRVDRSGGSARDGR